MSLNNLLTLELDDESVLYATEAGIQPYVAVKY